MKATKIKMKPGCSNSTKTTEIDQIYIEGCTNPGYFKKATLYDYLKSNPMFTSCICGSDALTGTVNCVKSSAARKSIHNPNLFLF